MTLANIYAHATPEELQAPLYLSVAGVRAPYLNRSLEIVQDEHGRHAPIVVLSDGVEGK